MEQENRIDENCTLYDIFHTCAPSFNVIFHDIETKRSMGYDDINLKICQVAERLKTIVTNSVLGCVIRPSLIFPVITLGISKITCPFAYLDVQNPLSSLKKLQTHVPVKNLLIEVEFLNDIQHKLCVCWKKKGEFELDASKPIAIFQSSDCNNKFCLQFSMNYSNFRNVSELAYVIQTSGTTGEPKIVQVPHQCIVPNIIDLKRKFNVSSEDVLLLCAPLTFDPSIVEMFLAISSGCTLVITSDHAKSIPRVFLDVIKENKVTFIQATPSLILSLSESSIKEVLLSDDSKLRALVFGGEDCPSLMKLKRLKSAKNKTRIFNIYGLTEVSCWASCHEIYFDNSSISSGIPLGEPLLETNMELKSDGELYVGGAKRWCIINDEVWPSHGNCIMRATGDLAIKGPNNLYYYAGRKDNTFKYKGQKISFHQISAVLEDIQDIGNHCVCFDQKSEKLFFFVVLRIEISSINEIKRKIIKYARKSIPHLPVIEAICVSNIPLTRHGKSNHRKLLELAKSEPHQDKSIRYENDYSCIDFISNLWKEYTFHDTISKDDNFIIKGGNSISALQFSSDIQTEFQITVPDLVEKILNQTFEDVLALVETHLQVPKLSQIEKIPQSTDCIHCFESPPPKKKCINAVYCYKVVSRKGPSTVCLHPHEHAHDTKKEMKDPNIILTLKCTFDMKKCVDASPCAVYFYESEKTLVFIGSHSGIFSCMDIKKELLVWSQTLPDRIESSACLSHCGKYVFVGCYDFHMYCFDIITGSIQWKFQTNAVVKSSPVVSTENIVFIGSHDKYLYALSALNGQLLWKKKIAKGSIFSSPSLSDTISAVIVATLDGVVAALKMDSGETIWHYFHEKPLFSSPLCTSDSVFIGSASNMFIQLDLQRGSLLSNFSTNGPVFSSPFTTSTDGNIIFGCHDYHLYCINSNNECLWKFCCDSCVYGTPFAFQWSEENYVIAVSVSGKIYLLLQNNGELKYTWSCPGQIFSSPVVLNNYLIFGCRDNFVYCYTLSSVT